MSAVNMRTSKYLSAMLCLVLGLGLDLLARPVPAASVTATVTVGDASAANRSAESGSSGAKAGADAAAAPDTDKADSSDSKAGDSKAGDNKPGDQDSTDRAIVNVGSDSHLPAGESADAVVSVWGNATSDGTVRDAVVAVFGDARSNGDVGDSVVAVIGNNSVNGSVGDSAVTVFGDLTLGPNARVGGDAVVVGGKVLRDPDAKVTGQVVNVLSGLHNAGPHLQLWFRDCVLLGRPLAFAHGLEWAWVLAGVALAVYLLIAMLGGNGLRRCAEVIEQRPGLVVLSAIAAWVLVPAAYIVLVITVIGMVATPILSLALLGAHIFGRAVMIAWVGRQLLGIGGAQARQQMVPAVFIGGALVALLYCVPVLGFLLFMFIGWLGFGAVLATLYLGLQRRRAERAALRSAARTEAQARAAASASASMASDSTAADAAATAAGVEAPATDDAPAASGSGTAGPEAFARAATPTPEVVDANASERATLGVRLAALAIDLALVGIVVANLPMLGAFGSSGPRFFLLCAAVYGALFWRFKGTTIGGALMRTRVLRVDGRPLDWPTVVVRGISCIVSALPVGLGFFWIGFDADRQSWHDKLAGTVVVRTRQSTSLV